MHENKRNGALDSALLVHEVHVYRAESVDFDLRLEHGEFVHLLFFGAPVEFVEPVGGYVFDISPGWLLIGRKVMTRIVPRTLVIHIAILEHLQARLASL
jgi:hypothetical protein